MEMFKFFEKLILLYAMKRNHHSGRGIFNICTFKCVDWNLKEGNRAVNSREVVHRCFRFSNTTTSSEILKILLF